MKGMKLRFFLSGAGAALGMCLAAGCRRDHAAVQGATAVPERSGQAVGRAGVPEGGRKLATRVEVAPVGSSLQMPEIKEKIQEPVTPLRQGIDGLMTLVGLDRESAEATAAELQRVRDLLKGRRREAIRGKAIALGKALDFPAQTERALIGLVEGMNFPAGVTEAQAERIRQMTLTELGWEYGLRTTVTPKIAKPAIMSSIMRYDPEVVYQVDRDGGIPTFDREGFCRRGGPPVEWAFDFLVTPELIAAQEEAQRDFRERVAAGVEPRAAAEQAVKKAMPGR